MNKREFNWAILGTGVVANEMANALKKAGKSIYAVGNRTHSKAVDFAEKYGKNVVIPGMEPTGHYWFNLGAYLQDNGMKPVHVNPHHVRKSKELDDNELKCPKIL